MGTSGRSEVSGEAMPIRDATSRRSSQQVDRSGRRNAARRPKAQLDTPALTTGTWCVLASSSHPDNDRPSKPPPAHLLPILDELLRGTNDATASRNLYMSPRTFSRRVAELLSHLDATTRFQAGAEAVMRGWVVVRRRDETEFPL